MTSPYRLGIDVEERPVDFVGYRPAVRWLRKYGVYMESDHNGVPFPANYFAESVKSWPPPRPHKPLSNDAVKSFVDATLAITLERENARWHQLRENFLEHGWILPWPERFDGIDAPVPPPEWIVSRGAWGCMLSHRAAIREAIRRGLKSVCIVESDCIIGPEFAGGIARFLADVPPDWEMLMIGGCDTVPTEFINLNVVRLFGHVNWHCYIVRDRLMADLLAHLEAARNHCDVCVWPWLAERKVYAPSGKYLAGQAAGFSNNTLEEHEERWWNRQRIERATLLSTAAVRKIFGFSVEPCPEKLYAPQPCRHHE